MKHTQVFKRVPLSRAQISLCLKLNVLGCLAVGDLCSRPRMDETQGKLFKGAMSRPRMRVQSRNSLKNLASIFQSRRGERIRNFIGKYLCHPWVVYSFDSCYKSSDCCRVFTCGFWLVFDVLCVNFRWCCDALWCLLEAVDDLEVVGRDSTRAKFWWKKGHRRILLDHRCYFSWAFVKISGGYRGDSAISGRLYSLERRSWRKVSQQRKIRDERKYGKMALGAMLKLPLL